MARAADLGETFQREAAAQFGFLRELGYGPPELETTHSDVLGPTYSLTWTAPRRQVIATLFDTEPHAMVVAFVYRLPHESVDDKLHLGLFIQKYRPDLHQRLAQPGPNEKTTPEERLRSVLPAYRAVLEGEAWRIVTGEEWQQGFFEDWTLA
jgi:hypothetical protein